jgi:hypothetical protein
MQTELALLLTIKGKMGRDGMSTEKGAFRLRLVYRQLTDFWRWNSVRNPVQKQENGRCVKKNVRPQVSQNQERPEETSVDECDPSHSSPSFLIQP